MSGGGKGGQSTTEVKIPEWLETAARGNIGRAENVAALGPMPYYGPDVAAMTPMQTAAGQGINTAAGAFGLGTTDLSMGMPAPQTFAGGVQGYSSGGLYDQSLAELQRRAPGQYNAITGMFINPQTGAAPLSFGSSVPTFMPSMPTIPAPAPAPVVDRGGSDRAPLAFGGSNAGAGGGRGTTSMATPASYMPGGVNTRNPNSAVNRVAAALSRPQSAPTQANRPVARSVATTNPSASTQASMAKAAAANAANRTATSAKSGAGSSSSSSASTAAAAKAAADKAAADKAAAERAARDRIAAAEKAAADKKAADAKAAEARAAAERQARDRIAAAERDRAASNRAAANKSTRDAAQGKGGKSGPSSRGNRSSGGSNATRR